VKHNHVTRDIKPEGECPACDKARLKLELEDMGNDLEVLGEMYRDQESKLKKYKAALEEKRNEYIAKVEKYRYYQFNVKAGDVIQCGDEEYRLVGFKELSTDPIVNAKLKSGKWSKREQQLHLYDWETKDIIKWSL
jgi:hypothetical protein